MWNFLCTIAALLWVLSWAAGPPKEEDLITNDTLMVLRTSANEAIEELKKEPLCDEWCQQERDL